MADWVHCNKCFVRYKEDVKFNLTRCYHIVCDKCCSKTEHNTCPVCDKAVAIVALTKDLNDRIKAFFLPIEESLSNSLEIVKFQNSQMLSLIKNLQTKYASAKSEVLRFYKISMRLKQENQKLIMQYKQSNSPFQCGSGGFATSTPASSLIRSNNFTIPMSSTMGSDQSFTPINPSDVGNRHNPYLGNQQWPGKAHKMKSHELDQMKMYGSSGLPYSSKHHHGGPVPVHSDGSYHPRRDPFKPMGSNN